MMKTSPPFIIQTKLTIYSFWTSISTLYHPTELHMVKTTDASCCYRNNNVCACHRDLAPPEIFTNASQSIAEILCNSMHYTATLHTCTATKLNQLNSEGFLQLQKWHTNENMCLHQNFNCHALLVMHNLLYTTVIYKVSKAS